MRSPQRDPIPTQSLTVGLEGSIVNFACQWHRFPSTNLKFAESVIYFEGLSFQSTCLDCPCRRPTCSSTWAICSFLASTIASSLSQAVSGTEMTFSFTFLSKLLYDHRSIHMRKNEAVNVPPGHDSTHPRHGLNPVATSSSRSPSSRYPILRPRQHPKGQLRGSFQLLAQATAPIGLPNQPS